MWNFHGFCGSIPGLLAAGEGNSVWSKGNWGVGCFSANEKCLSWHFAKSSKTRVLHAVHSLLANAASSVPLLSNALYKCRWLSHMQGKWCWWVKLRNLLTLLSEVTPSTNENVRFEGNSTQNLHSDFFYVYHPFLLIIKLNSFPYIDKSEEHYAMWKMHLCQNVVR